MSRPDHNDRRSAARPSRILKEIRIAIEYLENFGKGDCVPTLQQMKFEVLVQLKLFDLPAIPKELFYSHDKSRD